MLGGAFTAPLLPSASFGAAAKAGYPAAALHAAIYQARSDVSFSVFTLAKRLGLGVDQAEQLMRDMSARGILGPLQGTTKAGRWARSQVWTRPKGAVVASAKTVTGKVNTHTKTIPDPYQNHTQEIDEQTVHKDEQERSTGLTPRKETPMQKFDNLSGIAAPMPLVNIDTDMIIPKIFLKTIKRSGLGVNLFDEMRFDRQGNEIPDFVLNKPAYREASILVAGDNFGCGSSREHAPWAIADFGIRCVISTSFADIFYNNCFKNGILPIVLPEDQRDALMKDAEKGANARIEIDLESQTVTSSDGDVFNFEVDSFKKHCLMNGLDDIGLTMEKATSIDSFETQVSAERPWV